MCTVTDLLPYREECLVLEGVAEGSSPGPAQFNQISPRLSGRGQGVSISIAGCGGGTVILYQDIHPFLFFPSAHQQPHPAGITIWPGPTTNMRDQDLNHWNELDVTSSFTSVLCAKSQSQNKNH